MDSGSRIVLVSYNDDTHLHERIILEFGEEDVMFTCTPHYEVYAKRWEDWAEVFRSGTRQGVPRKWFAADTRGRYVLFRHPELTARGAEFQELADAECDMAVDRRQLVRPAAGGRANNVDILLRLPGRGETHA